jgi:hypothetical protein
MKTRTTPKGDELEPPNRDESRRLNARAYESAWREWFATLSREEQAQLRAAGMAEPIVERSSRRSSGEFDDPAEAPEASEDPREQLEELEPMTATEQQELEAAFGQALAWAAQGADLVDMGRRLSVMLHIYKPALIRGLALEIQAEMRAELEETVGEIRSELGEAYGCALEWVSRGKSLSQWGQRLLAALYVMRPAAIEDATLETIGAHQNKTRQAIDKLVQDFRDTFQGIKSAAMRSDETRIKCKHAQLHRQAA